LEYRPKVIVVSERRRQHLFLDGLQLTWVQEQQSWFTGCYIVSVDSAHVFPVEPMLEFMRGNTNVMPAELGSFVEVEIEFERDIADSLDDRIAAGQTNLATLRDAFLQDQDMLISLITDHINYKAVTDLTAMYTVKGELEGNERFVPISDTAGVTRSNVAGIILGGLAFTNEATGGYLVADTETEVPVRTIFNRNSVLPSGFAITEFSTINSRDAIVDPTPRDGNYAHDWIEIQNTSNETKSLQNWYLSDTDDLTRCQFPLSLNVPAGGFCAVFVDSSSGTNQPLHFDFAGGGFDA
jgi:hypothetical protein